MRRPSGPITYTKRFRTQGRSVAVWVRRTEDLRPDLRVRAAHRTENFEVRALGFNERQFFDADFMQRPALVFLEGILVFEVVRVDYGAGFKLEDRRVVFALATDQSKVRKERLRLGNELFQVRRVSPEDERAEFRVIQIRCVARICRRQRKIAHREPRDQCGALAPASLAAEQDFKGLLLE
jgi:hypothetical protein